MIQAPGGFCSNQLFSGLAAAYSLFSQRPAAGTLGCLAGFTFLPRYGPTINVSHEVVGLLILVLLAARRQFRVAAILLLIWLALEELRPFQFRGPPQPFWWLPFESWFVGAPESYYGTFFGKLFLYCDLVGGTERRRPLDLGAGCIRRRAAESGRAIIKDQA